MSPLTSDDVRLEDPDFYFEGRREAYTRLHAEAPVFYYEPLGIFVLTKHEDIARPRATPSCSAPATACICTSCG